MTSRHPGTPGTGAAHLPHVPGRDARTLRVGFSGLFLRTPENGTGRYARSVLQQIVRAPGVQPVVFTDGALPDLAALHCRMIRVPGGPERWPASARKVVWEQAGLAFAAARTGVDVLYSPHFSLPLVLSAPGVISIHDVIPLTEPAYRGSRTWQWYFAVVGAAARRARAVLTLSEYAAGEIRRVLAIDAARIEVVNPGIEGSFQPVADAAITRARAAYALPERYLLYVGGSVAHKNIGLLFQALALLQREHPGSVLDQIPALVVVAPRPVPAASPRYPDWRGMAAAMGVAERVHFIERVAEADLAAVYSGSLAFLFPSRNEGFGMTPLEAMACGVPVLCSSAAGLPEAVGDAALQAAPDDVPAWAARILALCTDSRLRSGLCIAGQARAARFTWERTGDRVLDVLRGAVR